MFGGEIILTGKASSQSEKLISALRPVMPVFTIPSGYYGEDKNNNKNNKHREKISYNAQSFSPFLFKISYAASSFFFFF